MLKTELFLLQTGFGGGKTHTLISLFHLCKWGKGAINSPFTQNLLQSTGVPEFESASIAVFTNTTNDAANGRHVEAGVHIQTIWGEIAYQLGGKEAYEIVRKNDEQLIAPAGIFKKVLEHCKPALILIDELADYCVKASARKAGDSSLADQTISFMQELTEAVAGTNNCVAVITLPASPQEVGNTPQAQAILSSLQKE
jgi:predicted AAA+ superfamily ATPase